jgi:hypothetical protein
MKYESIVVRTTQKVARTITKTDAYLRANTPQMRLWFVIPLFIFCFYFFAAFFSLGTGGRHSAHDYTYDGRILEEAVLKLEYLTILTERYVKKGGDLPRGEVEINSAFHTFRESAAASEDFADYIRSLVEGAPQFKLQTGHFYKEPDAVPNGAPLPENIFSRLAMRMLDADEENNLHFSPYPKPADPTIYSFFKRQGDAIYVGIRAQKISKRKGFQEFLRVIVSMMEGEYFQDFDETPYDSGPVLIKKICL